jgi:hypothetical protein
MIMAMTWIKIDGYTRKLTLLTSLYSIASRMNPVRYDREHNGLKNPLG